MNMKLLLVILSIAFFTLNSFGQDKKDVQDKKEIVEKKIHSKQNFQLDVANGDTEPYLEKEEFYNLTGDVEELKEYTDNGITLSRWIKYKYDSQGNLIEEQNLNSKGEQKERFEYKYKDGLKTEKLYYDSKNHLVKKKIFKYEFRK